MKTSSRNILIPFVLVAVLFLFGIFFWFHKYTPQRSAGSHQSDETRVSPEPVESTNAPLPFDVDVSRGETDSYFGPPVAYDPADKTMQAMRQWMLGLVKAMDNTNHPCNPLFTAKTKITGVNIKPLNRGDKKYTMWFSDGHVIYGMEGIHLAGGWGSATLEGDFFQSLYVRAMAGGFGYGSKIEADEILKPNKKSFWKKDIGEVAHDMVANAFGSEFLKDTLPQEYSGFFVSDALNGSYIENGQQHSFFTKNLVTARLKRTDLTDASPYDQYYTVKFEVHFEAVPTASKLAFKVVCIDANENGINPASWNRSGQKSAVKFQ